MPNETTILIIIAILVALIVAARTYLSVLHTKKDYEKTQKIMDNAQEDWEEKITDYDKYEERRTHALEHLRELSHKSAKKDLENDLL